MDWKAVADAIKGNAKMKEALKGLDDPKEALDTAIRILMIDEHQFDKNERQRVRYWCTLLGVNNPLDEEQE